MNYFVLYFNLFKISFVVSFLVVSFFSLAIYLYKYWYPFSISYVHVFPGPTGKCVFEPGSCFPSKRWERSVFFENKVSCVCLGSGYVAFCALPSSFGIPSDLYIFKVSRFGRLQSSDLSSRSLSDAIINFTKENLL